MRNFQPSRRVVVQIMKSPSPDIANRNIIRQTKAPVDDIKKHLVEKSRSKSPRIIDRQQNLDQLQYFRKRIQQLEKIIRQLKMQNGEYRKLLQQKKVIQNPNKSQLSRMRDTIRSYDGSQSPTPRNQKDKAAKLLEHMQNKMMEVLNENKRIGNLLQEKQNQNKRLKNQLDSKDQNKPTTPRNQSQSQYQNNLVDPNRLKGYFETYISPQLQKSEGKWLSIIRDMQAKINILKQRQDLLEKQLQKNKNQSPALQNQKKSPFSNAKTSQPADSIFPSGYYQPYSIRPFEDITKSGQKEHNDPEYLQIQQRCQVLQKDNETYRKKIIELEKQNQRMKQSSTVNTRVATFENDEQLRKNFQLQRELDENNYKLNSIQRQLRSVQQDYNRLKQRTDRQFYLLQNEKNTCKKALQQQKQKYNQIEDSYYKLNQRNQLTEQKLRQKQQAHEKLSNQIKQMIKQWANKQNNIKNYYSQLLKNKDKDFGEELHRYLQLLDNIRKDIQNCNIDQIITQNQAFGQEKLSLEKELLLIREQNKKLLYQLKSRLVQQEQRIIQLEKDNQMLRTQVRELENQKQKLKKAMLQFDNFKVMPHNMTSSSSINSVQQPTYKSESGCKLKACLKQTIKKIDNLEQQITQILME